MGEKEKSKRKNWITFSSCSSKSNPIILSSFSPKLLFLFLFPIFFCFSSCLYFFLPFFLSPQFSHKIFGLIFQFCCCSFFFLFFNFSLLLLVKRKRTEKQQHKLFAIPFFTILLAKRLCKIVSSCAQVRLECCLFLNV